MQNNTADYAKSKNLRMCTQSQTNTNFTNWFFCFWGRGKATNEKKVKIRSKFGKVEKTVLSIIICSLILCSNRSEIKIFPSHTTMEWGRMLEPVLALHCFLFSSTPLYTHRLPLCQGHARCKPKMLPQGAG